MNTDSPVSNSGTVSQGGWSDKTANAVNSALKTMTPDPAREVRRHPPGFKTFFRRLGLRQNNLSKSACGGLHRASSGSLSVSRLDTPRSPSSPCSSGTAHLRSSYFAAVPYPPAADCVWGAHTRALARELQAATEAVERGERLRSMKLHLVTLVTVSPPMKVRAQSGNAARQQPAGHVTRDYTLVTQDYTLATLWRHFGYTLVTLTGGG